MLESWVSTNCTVPLLEGTIRISVVGSIYVFVALWTTVKDDVVHAGRLLRFAIKTVNASASCIGIFFENANEFITHTI